MRPRTAGEFVITTSTDTGYDLGSSAVSRMSRQLVSTGFFMGSQQST